MSNCAIIIPALNPPEGLIEYVKALLENCIPQIIIVNDGSKKELTYIFNELSQLKGCTVLTHEKNKGKGRALKTAFHYFLDEHNELRGVITADADGQHSILDVLKIAKELGNTDNLILGVRDFRGSNVPARSYIGNRITSFLYQLFYGTKLRDTQTGLRGIPKEIVSQIVNLKGERYEYEINMLIFARKIGVEIDEIPIQTLYFNNNSGSHYNSIKDSLRVFSKLISGLLTYSFSTLTSGFIDIATFILLNSFILAALPLQVRLLIGTVAARSLSSSYNFFMNRRYVFKGENKLTESIIKYYILFFGFIFSSYILVLSAKLFMNTNIILTKILIDALQGILSYKLQLNWVYKKQEKHLAGESNGN